MSVGDIFTFTLELANEKCPGVLNYFAEPATSDEINDLKSNASFVIPEELIEILRIANGQYDVIGGPFWIYRMLSGRDILERKSLYSYYFANNEVPIFEEGNGGFVTLMEDGSIRVTDYMGTILGISKSLSSFFKSYANLLEVFPVIKKESSGITYFDFSAPIDIS